MKKIIRLTESDLIKLVKKVINEQEFDYDMVSSFAGRKRSEGPKTSQIENALIIEDKTDEEVSEVLSDIPSDLMFLSIKDCEFADFNGVDLCSSNLIMLRIIGTPSNFKVQNYDCIENEMDDGFYALK